MGIKFSPRFDVAPTFATSFTARLDTGSSGIYSPDVAKIRVLDLAEYNNIPHDAQTLYFIKG